MFNGSLLFRVTFKHWCTGNGIFNCYSFRVNRVNKCILEEVLILHTDLKNFAVTGMKHEWRVEHSPPGKIRPFSLCFFASVAALCCIRSGVRWSKNTRLHLTPLLKTFGKLNLNLKQPI